MDGLEAVDADAASVGAVARVAVDDEDDVAFHPTGRSDCQMPEPTCPTSNHTPERFSNTYGANGNGAGPTPATMTVAAAAVDGNLSAVGSAVETERVAVLDAADDSLPAAMVLCSVVSVPFESTTVMGCAGGAGRPNASPNATNVANVARLTCNRSASTFKSTCNPGEACQPNATGKHASAVGGGAMISVPHDVELVVVVESVALSAGVLLSTPPCTIVNADADRTGMANTSSLAGS